MMRALFLLIPLAMTALAGATDSANEDAIIAELLSYAVPAEDWQEYLKKRKEAGWVPPPMPSFIPTADGDIDRLVGYWNSEDPPHEDKPDAQVRSKLLAHCEEHPAVFGGLSKWFAATEDDTLKRIQKLYDRLSGSTAEEDIQARQKVRHWLMTQAGMFRDELESEAELYFANPEDAERQASFEAYLKYEPATAKVMLVKHAEDASPAARCAALLRLHGLKDAQAESWRKALQTLVTSDAPVGIRAPALKRLVEVDWPEKTEWVLGLFQDAALGGVKVGPHRQEEPVNPLLQVKVSDEDQILAVIVKAKPDFWVPKIIPLVGNVNRTVHDSAVRCLAQFHLEDKREDALRALLPWLSDPKWALDGQDHDGRLRLIQSVDMVNLPESVPGLLWVLKHDSEDMRRVAAAAALAHYRAGEAVPAVREEVVKEPDLWYRRQFIEALLELKGMTLAEQVLAVEEFEAQLLTEEGRKALEQEDKLSGPGKPKSGGLDPARRLLVTTGAVLCAREPLQSEGLTQALSKRVRELRPGNPPPANAIETRISLWNTPTGRELIGERLRGGRLEAPWLARLFNYNPPRSTAEIVTLSIPPGTETTPPSPLPMTGLRSLQGLPETTAAIVALLLEDENRMRKILTGKNGNAQAMLLACARLKRAALPLTAVGMLLSSKDSLCARGALRYLEAEDSPEARALVLSRFKGQARILGAHDRHDGDHVWNGEMHRAQEGLRKRVLEAKRPLEIHALLSEGAWGGEGQVWIEIDDGKAMVFNDQGNERYGTRLLTEAELAEFKAYVAQQRVDELPPLRTPVMDGVQYEYLHLTANGGRRVFMNNPGSYAMYMGKALPEDQNDSVYVSLARLFEKLVKDKSKLSVGYHIADEVKGLRILIPREHKRVWGVMQRDGVLMVNTLRPADAPDRWTAVTVDGAALPGKDEKRPALSLPNADLATSFVVRDQQETAPWRTATAGGGHVILAKRNKDEVNGLWLCRDKQEPELIAKGGFSSPNTTSDGRWVVAYQWEDAAHKETRELVRINLATRETIPIEMAAADIMGVQGRVPDSGKILLTRSRHAHDSKEGPEKTEYTLIDPATGALERVTGQFRPLEQETWRALQPTGEPHMVWAAMPWLDNKSNNWSTRIGRYDLRTFTFTEVMNIPRLSFNSMDFWVDAKTQTVFLALGDLLSFPLPEADRKEVAK